MLSYASAYEDWRAGIQACNDRVLALGGAPDAMPTLRLLAATLMAITLAACANRTGSTDWGMWRQVQDDYSARLRAMEARFPRTTSGLKKNA